MGKKKTNSKSKSDEPVWKDNPSFSGTDPFVSLLKKHVTREYILAHFDLDRNRQMVQIDDTVIDEFFFDYFDEINTFDITEYADKLLECRSTENGDTTTHKMYVHAEELVGGVGVSINRLEDQPETDAEVLARLSNHVKRLVGQEKTKKEKMERERAKREQEEQRKKQLEEAQKGTVFYL